MSQKPWRPDNWKNPADDYRGDSSAVEFANGFEAGADAMLKARDEEIRSKIQGTNNECSNTVVGNKLFRAMILAYIPDLPEDESK